MPIDIVFFIISYAALHLGFKRGLVRATFGFFGWLMAFIFAVKLTPWATGVIYSIINADLQVNPLIAFAILMFVGWRIVDSIGSASASKVSGDDITVFNGLAGSGLYWVAFMLTYSLILRTAQNYDMLPSSITDRSRIYSQMLSRYPDAAMKGLTYLLPFIADGWNVLDESISGINDSLEKARPDVSNTPPSSDTPPDNAPPTSSDVNNQPPEDQPLPSVFDKNPSDRQRRYKREE